MFGVQCEYYCETESSGLIVSILNLSEVSKSLTAVYIIFLCLTSLAHVYSCSGNARQTWTADIALVKLQSAVKAIAILTIHIFLKAHVGYVFENFFW